MAEAGVAVAILALVTALGWLGPLVLLVVGVAVAGTGLVGSVAIGVAYHRRLLAAAGRLGALRAGWWWAPSRLHTRLDEDGRRSVLPVFRAGVLVVALSLGGLVLVAMAAAKAWLLSR